MTASKEPLDLPETKSAVLPWPWALPLPLPKTVIWSNLSLALATTLRGSKSETGIRKRGRYDSEPSSTQFVSSSLNLIGRYASPAPAGQYGDWRSQERGSPSAMSLFQNPEPVEGSKSPRRICPITRIIDTGGAVTV